MPRRAELQAVSCAPTGSAISAEAWHVHSCRAVEHWWLVQVEQWRRLVDCMRTEQHEAKREHEDDMLHLRTTHSHLQQVGFVSSVPWQLRVCRCISCTVIDSDQPQMGGRCHLEGDQPSVRMNSKQIRHTLHGIRAVCLSASDC